MEGVVPDLFTVRGIFLIAKLLETTMNAPTTTQFVKKRDRNVQQRVIPIRSSAEKVKL